MLLQQQVYFSITSLFSIIIMVTVPLFFSPPPSPPPRAISHDARPLGTFENQNSRDGKGPVII